MFFPSEAITRDGSFFLITMRMIQPISLKTASIGCIAYIFLVSRAQKSIRISNSCWTRKTVERRAEIREGK